MKFNFDSFYGKYADWILKWKKSIVWGTLLLVLALAAGARFLYIDGDMLQYFPKDMPQRLALDKIHDEYERTDNVLVVIAPQDGEVFTQKTLAKLEKITDELWKTPFASRVDAITNFQHTEVKNDELTVSNLVENAAQKTDDEIQKIKALALSDEDLVKRLISPTGHVTGVALTIKFPKKDFLSEGPAVVKYVRDLEKKYENDDLKIYLTGTVFVDNAFAEAGQKDMQTLTPLMYGIMILLLAFFFRSTVGILASVFITLISVAVSLGIFGYFGVPINPITTAAPTMIITIVIADGIHFFITVAQLISNGVSKENAIKEAIKLNFKPFLVTGITNILGYVSLNFSDSPPFRELGNMVALGMFVGWMLSIIWLPALIALLPLKVKNFKMEREFNFEKYAHFVTRNYKKVLVVFTIATLVLTPLIYKNVINDMFLNFFHKDLDIRKDTEFAVENLTGLYSIEYTLNAGGESISSPAYLKKLSDFENWFKSQDKVIHVSSVVSTMKRLNKIMHNNDPAFNKIPDNQQLAAQYLLMYEMSLPYGRDLNNQINMEKTATRFRVVFENMNTASLKNIEGKANNWLKENAPASMYSNGTSTSVMFRYLSEKNIDNMLWGYGSALLIIAIVMMLAIKSVKFGLLSLIPNILPTVFAFGLWGFFVGEVGLAVAFVTSFSSGIVVDDSVHFFVKYMRARREMGYSPAQAIVYTFKTIGSSMFVSTLILSVGFSVLIFSPFQSNSSMGILCSITIFIALISDFFLTPALLLAFDKGKTQITKVEKMSLETIASI